MGFIDGFRQKRGVMVKQSFSFQWKDNRVFGCSFKLAPNGQYFGWVTIYKNRNEYNHSEKLTTYTDIKNIPLKCEKLSSAIVLREYCKTF